MKRTNSIFLLAILGVLFHITSAYSLESVVLTNGRDRYPLGRYLEYMEDPSCELTIEDLASGRHESRFATCENEIETIGFSDSAYWVRIRLRNQDHARADWLLAVKPTDLDFVDFRLRGENGRFQARHAGDRRPFNIREVEHRLAAFKVDLPPRSERTLYLRFQSEGLLVFDLALWHADAFHVHSSGVNLFWGCFLGALCMMAAYHLFLFAALGDRAYLHYVLFLFSAMMLLATFDLGFSHQYLWPEQPEFNQTATILFSSMAMISALNFAAAFLMTKMHAPTLHRFVTGFRPVFVLLAILSFMHKGRWAFMTLAVFAVAAIFLIMLAGIRSWLKGYRPARYYILAWSMMWFNAIAFSVHSLNLANFPNHVRGAPFTITCLVLFLSLALADRINMLKRKTDEVNRQLGENQKRLVHSEKKYRTIFEESNDMIFMTDKDGRIEDVNPACEKLLGVTRSEALMRNALDAYANPDDRERFMEIVLRNGAVKDFEVRLRRLDGREIDVMVSAALRHAEDGRVLGFQGIAHDMTAIKKAEAERRRALEMEAAKELAEAANRAKSTFLANMSHELRTPMNSILGFAKVMTRSLTLSSEDRGHLTRITRNGEHLLTLINQVLDLSKIEAGRTTLNKKDTDLFRLLDDIKDIFCMKANRKDLNMVFERGENVPRYIHADEVKIRQILMNLLGNAVKFTDTGAVTLKTSLANEAPGDADGEIVIRFEVDDTGPGIAPEDMGKVFEAFGQTSAGLKSGEGTGLGLQISRKFAQLMGGDMRVESEVCRGTAFTFEIRAREVGSVISRPAVRCPVALEPGQTRCRMLITDDNSDNRRLLKDLLDPFGFDLREAVNGTEAIDVWDAWRPHLIWMDIRMPVMDGYEAVKAIREKEQKIAGKDRPVIIAVTASSYEDEREAMLSAGCDDFLRKPFIDTEIFEMLRKHLGLRFVYREECDAECVPKEEYVLTAESFDVLPGELLETLEQGARRADFILLSGVIDRIREHDTELAGALARLAEDFEYDRILAYLPQNSRKTP